MLRRGWPSPTSCCVKEAKHRRPHGARSPLQDTARSGKSTDTESRLQVSRNGRKGEREVVITRVQAVLRGDAKVVKLDRGNGCTTL